MFFCKKIYIFLVQIGLVSPVIWADLKYNKRRPHNQLRIELPETNLINLQTP